LTHVRSGSKPEVPAALAQSDQLNLTTVAHFELVVYGVQQRTLHNDLTIIFAATAVLNALFAAMGKC
jgi:hypothetical protein